MRKYIALTLCTFTINCFAQPNPIDSLRNLLRYEKEDTTRILLLDKLSYVILYSKPDSAMFLAQQAFALAKKNNFAKGEAESLDRIANAFRITGNNSKALELDLQALQKAEAINYVDGIIDDLNNTGLAYYYERDYQQSISYYHRALMLAERIDDKPHLDYVLGNLGESYQKLNKLDSARYFANRSYDTAVKINDLDFIGMELCNLGNIYSGMGQNDIAMGYYKSGIPYLKITADMDAICEAYLGWATAFKKTGNFDSCLYYAKLSLINAQKANFPKRLMEASNFLTAYYVSVKNIDSAFAYQSKTIAAKDSLFSEEKIREIQNLSFNESARQQEIAEQKKKDEEDARKNLQRAGIAVFIPVFFLFVLLLSRTKIKSRTVEFLGIVGLLLFFEFITDLVYPYINNWTNESPIWETLILVILAACLEPISFKLEHWIKGKLVHKPVHVLKTSQ
jgi:tetratricopeptide (TPR) repeat protein